MKATREQQAHFTKIVKEICKEKKMTTKDLADKASITKTTLDKYISVESPLFPHKSTIKCIADALGIRPRALYFEFEKKCHVVSISEELEQLFQKIVILDLDIEVKGESSWSKHVRETIKL